MKTYATISRLRRRARYIVPRGVFANIVPRWEALYFWRSKPNYNVPSRSPRGYGIRRHSRAVRFLEVW